MHETDFVTFQDIHQLMEQMVIKYGCAEAHKRLLRAAQATNPVANNDIIIRNCIINYTIDVFGLSAKKFKKNNNTLDYKKARSSCFFLIKDHTKYSLEDIREFFKFETNSPIRYGIDKMKEIIDQPNIDKAQFKLHQALKGKVMEFINQIN